MSPFAHLSHYAPAQRLSAHASHLWVDGAFGFGLAVVAVLAALLALWAYSRARALGAEVWKRRGLRAGPVLLPGVAQPLDDTHAASTALIELSIHQQGSQHQSKQGPFIRWSETSRALVDRAFLLVTESGAEVRVEPGARIELVDRLEKPVRQLGTTRLRIARIVPGERIWVRGVLAVARSRSDGPYRGGDDGRAVLHPPVGGVLFVSSEPVENELRSLARFHFAFALLFAVLLALSQAWWFRGYHQLRSRGVLAHAAVTDHRKWQTHSKSPTYTHYGCTLEFDCPTGRAIVDEETNDDIYFGLADESEVPIVYLPSDPALCLVGGIAEIGTTHTRVIVAGGAMFAACFVYLWAAIARRPWWRRRKLVETEKGEL